MYSTKIKNNKKSSRSRSYRKLLLIILIVVILVAAFLVYWKFIRKSDKITLNTSPTASSQTKGETGSSSTPSDTSNQTPPTDGSSSPTTTTPGDKGSTGGGSPQTTATLTAPLGNFVSNHHPNLSGKPAPNQIQSVCNTTPGATCQISFTNGTITKSLPTQKTDTGGAAYWTWTLQNIGLTTGTWTIKATANFGAQTQTATDAASLVVRQ